jgi:hypothetical protein
MPISPQFVILLYDGLIYNIDRKIGDKIKINNENDIFSINQMQYIKARQNLYFSNIGQSERILKEFASSEAGRLERWNSVKTFIRDGSNWRGDERYRSGSEAERITARETLIALNVSYPTPSRWLSRVKFRTKPTAYSNGSSAGWLRKKEWLWGGLDKELGRNR